MKTKLISIFALAIIMASCSNQELSDSEPQQLVNQQSSNIRSYEEALQIAQASIQMVDGNVKTRATSSRKISFNDSKVCLTGNNTRSENGNDTLMYVFNFENNQGFSVISANKNTDPLIAVTESGHYDPEVPSGNEGFDLYIEMAKKYIRYSPAPILDPILLQKDSVVYSHSYVGPYVSVFWGQRDPEGVFCPNHIAGCSNTAVAQIMSYYESPTSIALTYEGADKAVQTLNWTSIKSSHLTGDTITMCIDTTSHYAIARLCRQLGKLSNSQYIFATDTTSAATGTRSDSTEYALQNIGWNTSGWIIYSESNVCNALNNYRPLLIMGTRIKLNGKKSSHLWVLDGYDDLQTTTYYFDFNLFSNTWELSYISYDYERLYHFNWGWYGKNNGYFAANVFNAAAVLFPDFSNNPATNNYTEDIETLTAYPN